MDTKHLRIGSAMLCVVFFAISTPSYSQVNITIEKDRQWTWAYKPPHLKQSRHALKYAYITTIIDTDNRKQVSHSDYWPYTAHGLIQSKWKNSILNCSGTMVHERHIMTAAHCLYDKEKGGEVEEVVFFPAKNGVQEPFKPAKVVAKKVTERWRKTEPESEDYGLIIVDRDLGKETGWYGLMILADHELDKKLVNITGYPGDKEEYTLWSDTDRINIAHSNANLLYHVTDIMVGQSGAAIWINEGTSPYIVGVQAYQNGSYNYGPRITQEVSDTILKWIKESS